MPEPLQYSLPNDIRTGSLSFWLSRPAPALVHYACSNAGEKAVRIGAVVPMVAVAGILYRGELRLPHEPSTWLLFAAGLGGLGPATVL